MNNFTRHVILFLLLIFIFYTRFIGLDWGLPYPMHPDERNMVVAITQLSCPEIGSSECLHPNFFAYGQFPMYAAFALQFIVGLVYKGSLFEHAAMSLRIISALASIGTVFMLVKTLQYFVKSTTKIVFGAIVLFSAVPAFIQFSHFGTTESLLMFFYTLLIYFALKLIAQDISLRRFSAISGIILGVALGTKVSALAFAAIPAVAFLQYGIQKKTIHSWIHLFFEGIKFGLFGFIFFVITSPFNFIDFQDFFGSMSYESNVGFGEYKAFYTRQFEYSLPIIFQFIKIFPYSLGWPIFSLFLLGFFFLPYTKQYNFLRLQFVIFFIPNAVFYAKWSRFISPVFPIMVLISYLMLVELYQMLLYVIKNKVVSRSFIGLVLLVSVIPGIAYTSIYLNPDVRFKASEWIYENMENRSYILSETANVIDVPIPNPKREINNPEGKTFTYISFNFYDLHLNPDLSAELETHIAQADYIFIPSRRVFSTHSCYVPYDGTFLHQQVFLSYESSRCAKLLENYPEVNAYYDRLFSGKLGFEQVAEFTSYPKIELFGFKLLELPDEMSEETWTVFDHPVIRIYKRIN